MKEKLYRVICICSECGEELMSTQDKPHLTKEQLSNKWAGLIMSAPLNAPKCPKCKYKTFRDCNMGTDFLIDDGSRKIPSGDFFEKDNKEVEI